MGAEIEESDPQSRKERLEDSFPIAGCPSGLAGRRKAVESDQSERFAVGNSAVRPRGLPRSNQIEGTAVRFNRGSSHLLPWSVR